VHVALASKHQKNATQLVTQRGAAIVSYKQGTSNARSLRHATTTLEKCGDLALRTLLALAGEEMPEPPATRPETAAAVALRECATNVFRHRLCVEPARAEAEAEGRRRPGKWRRPKRRSE